MTCRLLATFVFAALMAGLASAQDKPLAKDKTAAKAQIKAAVEAANEDMPKAIAMVEAALKLSPEEREGLYVLGAMTVLQGQKVDALPERIELARKSSAAFTKLQAAYKELNPNEKKFLVMSQLMEGRVLAAQGKADQAFASIKKAIDGGFDNFDMLKGDQDLESVCKLPAFQKLAEADYQAKLDEAKKQAAEEMASFKSFPFDFKLKDLDDKVVSLADYKGKITIVDVWGTWCPPCRAEIPDFVELLEKYKAKGLDIVGINSDEKGTPEQVEKTIRAFAKETKISYTLVLNDETIEAKIPGFGGYPTTLFLDRTGKVRMQVVGNQGKAKLEAIVMSLLAETPKSSASN